MDHKEKRRWLIRYLLDEKPGYKNIEITSDMTEQKRLLRSLFNVRVPKPISEDFLKVQDEYLQEATREKGITEMSDLTPLEQGIYLWQGDITTLACDAIVNAANSGMTGCYQPCHGCIDNCIHTYAGIQLRNECNDIMVRQGFEEPTGQAKITDAYNLPCRYVIHTVGPIVQGWLTKTHEELLRALLVSNLVTIHLKTGIGRLSAYCGAVSAGCGAGAGIAYLQGGGVDAIANTVINAIGIDSGIVCDGAKASCAAKIASAVDAGLMGISMYNQGDQFYGGDGIIKDGVEKTIETVGKLARRGMKETDEEIIRLMLED